MSTRPETLAPPAAPAQERRETTGRRAPTGGTGLSKKWHGIPVWAWVVVAGVGGYYLWTRVLHKPSTTTTTSTTTSSTPAPTSTTTPGGGVNPGGGPIPAPTPSLGTTPGTHPTKPAGVWHTPGGPTTPTPRSTQPGGPTPRQAATTANAAVKRANQDAAAAAARANAAVKRANQDAAAAAKRAQASIAHSNALAAAARNRATAHHVATKHVRSTGKKPASHVITSATGRIHRRRG